MVGGTAVDGKGAACTVLTPGALPGLNTGLSAAGPLLGITGVSGARPPCRYASGGRDGVGGHADCDAVGGEADGEGVRDDALGELGGWLKGARLPSCPPGPGPSAGITDMGAEAGTGSEMPEVTAAHDCTLLRGAFAGLLLN